MWMLSNSCFTDILTNHANFSKENQALSAQYHPKVPFSSLTLWRLPCTLQVRRTQEYWRYLQRSYLSALLKVSVIRQESKHWSEPSVCPPPAATATPTLPCVSISCRAGRNIGFSLSQLGKNGEDRARRWPTPAHGPGSIHTPIGFMQVKINSDLRNINREREDRAERRRSVLTEGTVAVIPLHPALAGSTIETGVALTVIDIGVTRFPCD